MKSLPKEVKLLAIKNAEKGEKVASICREIGISRKTFYQWYKKYQKAHPKHKKRVLQDRRFKAKISGHTLLTAEERNILINRISRGETTVSAICREYKIARKTFYKWKKRYQAEIDKGLKALVDKRPKSEGHYRYIPIDLQNKLLNLVIKNPVLSVHRLHQEFSSIGHHGIQSILEKRGLNRYEDRLAYSRNYQEALKPFIPKPTLFPIYNLTLRLFRMLIAPFVTIPKNKFSFNPELPLYFSATFITTFLFSLYWIKVIGQAQSPQEAIGLIFASIALTIGTIFFLYSMKYYLTLALVLGYSRQDKSGTGEVQPGFVDRIFGRKGDIINNDKRASASGLQPDISKIQLERHPFVSVHLASYNEKRVINRLLTAATSFDYPNYEVILVDDSSDPEAVSIVNEWRGHPRLKIIQRKDRVGFKGGALEEARKITDSQAEFVLVFDSDFIPYPDSITQFVKYFKAVGAWEEKDRIMNHESRIKDNIPHLIHNSSNIAAVQGYQWHVLNKSENWITRGVRSEYAGSYVIERSGEEIYGGLKQISGSVYMIKRKVLDSIKWGVSITEDFELTLKLYEKGYKVVYTPYIQAPSECVSTLKRLIRQRMRWAEGHSHNIKRMFNRLMFRHSPLTKAEKFEFLYLSPYYLQSAFFVVGTLCWFTAEVIFRVRLPFWTAIWGWSLVLTNLFALPLLNMVGLFLEEAEERDYLGIFSFIVTSYLLAPFQAYASVKGFIEKEEGPWFRTPKTGKITDTLERGKFYRWLSGFLPWKSGVRSAQLKISLPMALATSNNTFNKFYIPRRKRRNIVSLLLITLITSSSFLTYFSFKVPIVNTRTSAYAFTELAGPNKTSAPVRMKDGLSTNDLYDKIDTEQASLRNIIDSTHAGFAKEAKGNNFQVYFKETAAIPGFVMFVKDDYSIQYSLADSIDFGKVNTNKAQVYLNTIVYEDVYPNIDLRFTVKEDELLEEFIVADKETAARITKLSELLQPANVFLKQDADGMIGFYSPDEELAFSIPKPVMYELNNIEEKNYGLHYEIEPKSKEHQLTKVIDQDGYAWFSDVNRAYPVVVDASTVDTTTNTNPTIYSQERKTWFDSTYYWVAMYNGTNTEFWYSSDGASWTENAGATISGKLSSVYADSTRAYYVRDTGADLAFASATSYPGTGFDWSGETVPAIFNESSGRSFENPYIARDSSGYIWAITTHYVDTTHVDVQVARATNTDDITAWPDSTVVLGDNSGLSTNAVIVPLPSGDMYAAFNITTTIYGCMYDAQTSNRWEDSSGNDCTNGANRDTIATGGANNAARPVSLEVDQTNYDVHILYYASETKYNRWDRGTKAWQAAVAVGTGSNDYYQSITVDNATSDPYIFYWVLTDQKLYYRTCDYSAASSECNASGDWASSVNFGTSTSTSNTYPTSNVATSGRVFVIWRDSTASPYNVQFELILVPERTIWFIAVGFLIPWMLRKRKLMIYSCWKC